MTLCDVQAHLQVQEVLGSVHACLATLWGLSPELDTGASTCCSTLPSSAVSFARLWVVWYQSIRSSLRKSSSESCASSYQFTWHLLNNLLNNPPPPGFFSKWSAETRPHYWPHLPPAPAPNPLPYLHETTDFCSSPHQATLCSPARLRQDLIL